MTQRRIELLAPAKNLECGIAAVDHGADAVYIGAPRFGARAAATNSLDDIAALVQYAHLYNVKIYATVNTILKDEELDDTCELIRQLYHIGVDALIIQDMAILQMRDKLPPIPLHASTQMNNKTVEKVRFLEEAGFNQTVLARELSLKEIAEIHEAVPQMPLEVFVHGALCVSYSGQCYVSEACFGRSANRGECAQFCRLSFNMLDSDNKTIIKDKHLLSLKDMNRLNDLEDLLDAGVSSLKIEGRLKDVAYVKNITAAYRQALDKIFKRRPEEYIKASSGSCKYEFQPQPEKSFSRGFTNYFLRGRTKEITSFDTPKSLGEEMGQVKEVRGNIITVAGVKNFNNGDGVCFIDANGKLQGFRINKVENNRLYLQEAVTISPHTLLYRNNDQEFEKLLSHKSAERKINVTISLQDCSFGFILSMEDEDGNRVSETFPYNKELARTSQNDNIKNALTKLGNTPYEATQIAINLSDNWFIPSSVINEFRRKTVELLTSLRQIKYKRDTSRLNDIEKFNDIYPQKELSYLGNVMNKEAKAFYLSHGVEKVEPAFELVKPKTADLMFCKHCLRYAMGWCPVHQKNKSPYREPYYLETSDGKRFALEFDCKLCQMKIKMA